MNKNTTNEQNACPPRSVSEIKCQLAELAKIIESAEAYGTPDFASKMGLKSLRGLEEELRKELQAAEMLESQTNGTIARTEFVDSATPKGRG
jgi:hypothetical protein